MCECVSVPVQTDVLQLRGKKSNRHLFLLFFFFFMHSLSFVNAVAGLFGSTFYLLHLYDNIISVCNLLVCVCVCASVSLVCVTSEAAPERRPRRDVTVRLFGARHGNQTDKRRIWFLRSHFVPPPSRLFSANQKPCKCCACLFRLLKCVELFCLC